MDDGKLVFKVVSVDTKKFEAEVVVGGPLKSRKGVNLPDMTLDTNPLTSKDLDDLNYALDKGVDWVALSFVQQADDITNLKKIIGLESGKDYKNIKSLRYGKVMIMTDQDHEARSSSYTDAPKIHRGKHRRTGKKAQKKRRKAEHGGVATEATETEALEVERLNVAMVEQQEGALLRGRPAPALRTPCSPGPGIDLGCAPRLRRFTRSLKRLNGIRGHGGCRTPPT